MTFLSRLFRELYIHCTFESNVTGETGNFPIHNVLEMFIAYDILIACWQDYLEIDQFHNAFALYLKQTNNKKKKGRGLNIAKVWTRAWQHKC